MSSIAFFITPHGFGHAARACAVIQELMKMVPDLTPLILTTVPEEFFQNSLGKGYIYHPVQTDVGFVQRSALEVDMDKTIATLKTFYEGYDEKAKELKDLLIGADVQLVVSDVSPMGIQIAKELNLKSVLIENFTWDWIYEFYEDRYPELRPIANRIKLINRTAQYRIRTIPYCGEYDCDLIVAPISRAIRNTKDMVRKELNIGPEEKMILVSMGGVSEELTFLNQSFVNELRKYAVRIVCCVDVTPPTKYENVIFLPKFSNFYHPDLVNASDGVIGKLGYSTVSEVTNTGVPFAFVVREHYPEMDCLKSFVVSIKNTIEVNVWEFKEGNMIEKVKRLIELERLKPNSENGASECAEFIAGLL